MMWKSPCEVVILGTYLLECECGFISVLVPEVVVHAKVRLSPKLVTRLAVRDALNHSTLVEQRKKEK